MILSMIVLCSFANIGVNRSSQSSLDMEEFLEKTVSYWRSLDNFEELVIVYGNESCDLDSAVSALVYASFLFWQYNKMKQRKSNKEQPNENCDDKIFVPILNVNREDFDLKTEVLFCLSQFGINAEKLIFRNDKDLEVIISTKKVSVVLVDHHILAHRDEYLVSYVTEIIDHRPIDQKGWKYKENIGRIIQIVGSCATLICCKIKELATDDATKYFEMFPESAALLHSTIILDTVNFSKEVNKATPLDHEAVLFLESIIKPSSYESYREEKLKMLVEARKDVSKLDAGQLLKKDVKIVGKIIAPTLPIPVKEFLNRPDAEEAMLENLIHNQGMFLVLIGMKLDDDIIIRDLAVFSHSDNKHYAVQVCFV
ncbi:Exopolyphosphatase PRUNE1 [Eumeta japonica]|uniref:Exopolyphosphatase PRUNE1 n=1 Tax=Eumeta variegata TaxID=151549 RepID=A0A4C1Z0V0_EUMVA|nr:Exopolyphosphatase PRUNE1 [Eumeta japonica]